MSLAILSPADNGFRFNEPRHVFVGEDKGIVDARRWWAGDLSDSR